MLTPVTSKFPHFFALGPPQAIQFHPFCTLCYHFQVLFYLPFARDPQANTLLWILCFQRLQPYADLQCSVNLKEPERILKTQEQKQVQQSSTYETHQRQHVHQHDEMFVTCSLPVFILEGKRDRSARRGGRIGVDFFVVLVLFLSKGLLILERGAKIPENQ